MNATDAVRHNAAAARFELDVDGVPAVCAYRREGATLLLTHTEVPPHAEGRGIAARLVRATLDWARREGLTVRPLCSYVAAYMRRHPETQDLLDDAAAARKVQQGGMNDAARAILEFWFGAGDAPRAEWFRKDADFDARIRARFGAQVERALGGALLEWDAAPAGALARILLLDQFTRNIFRDTPRAFAGDAQALHVAESLVAAGRDKNLSPFQRWFAYLPFEHSESLLNQERSVALFAGLRREMQHEAFDSAYDYAVRHREVIERFGRFPHRNAILGRESTVDEIGFLRQPGSSF